MSFHVAGNAFREPAFLFLHAELHLDCLQGPHFPGGRALPCTQAADDGVFQPSRLEPQTVSPRGVGGYLRIKADRPAHARWQGNNSLSGRTGTVPPDVVAAVRTAPTGAAVVNISGDLASTGLWPLILR